ncbi:MAG: HmuY family protein [Bacteroidales bacterium]|nr:HmuY family protein [Bacteroidales bacterium]
MKKYQPYILLLLISSLLTSCFKEDERIMPYDRGDKLTAMIEMTQTYKYQVYFNLEDAQVVGVVNKQSFDLMFETNPAGSHIFLNSANFMTAARTGKTNLADVTSFAGLEMKFDPSTGNRDSTAIGNWFNINGNDTIFTNEVYVINRGYDDLGNTLGYRKIIFDSLKGQTYYFRYANLNGANEVSAQVTKMPEANFSYYAFNSVEGQLYPEPDKNQYDLLFTQYTTLLFTNTGEPYPYLVTGVLLNRFNTFSALNQELVFDSITRENAMEANFINRLDAIGYDWKEVVGDVSSGIVFYEVKAENNYFIRTQEGFYFKMRFVSFYNQSGEKGYPTIEFQKL